ncbi:hypothetical protein PHET_09453 [Paragonimus heterotremus]|uniref:Uncharacterized protein n=1 Tax=Paragonimus heterotremus TaxID=100268 RepID=A0A8J4WNU1_9TREM|nr:hypothetical protein PHET_09453 [Paragonimus heterotremus]
MEQISSDVQQVKAILFTRTSEAEVVARTVEQRLDLPEREIQRPYGNPKSCWSFIKEVQIAIEGKRTDNQARLTYLIRFCDGQAKVTIQLCIVLDAAEGYVLARSILRKRSDQNYIVTRSFIDEFLNGSRLSPGGLTALIYLVQQMRVYDSTPTQLKYGSHLNASISSSF